MGIFEISESLTERDGLDTGKGDDVTWSCRFSRNSLETIGHQEFGDLHSFHRAVGLDPHHLLTLCDLTFMDATECEATEIGRGIEVGDMSLKWRTLVIDRRRNGREDRLEEDVKILKVRHPTIGRLCKRCTSGLR